MGGKRLQKEKGFTLLEVMMVIIILSVLAAIAIPKFASSADLARRNADIATGHEIKTALDRYQAENGVYPKKSEVTITATGAVSNADFIPKYISKLDQTTTQQKAADTKMGFGVVDLPANGVFTDTPTNLVMIYLNDTGSGAEVRVFDDTLGTVLWSSTN